ETDFSLDADGRAKPTLTRFRLDPFNGLKGVPFEIEKVVLLRLPCRLEIVFGPAKSVARPGEPVELKLWLRHSGGRRLEGTMEARALGLSFCLPRSTQRRWARPGSGSAVLELGKTRGWSFPSWRWSSRKMAWFARLCQPSRSERRAVGGSGSTLSRRQERPG